MPARLAGLLLASGLAQVAPVAAAGVGTVNPVQDLEADLAAALAEADECGPSGAGPQCALSAFQHQVDAVVAGRRTAAAPQANLSAEATIPSVVTCAFAQDYSNLCGPSGFKESVVTQGPDSVQCTMCYEECCLASVRLTADGSCLSCATQSEGILEVYHDKKWGTVCDAGFDAADAAVVCKQLGYLSGGRPLHGVDVPLSAYREQKPIWLDNVDCTGQESAIEDCPAAEWGVSNCSHTMDVYVKCFA